MYAGMVQLTMLETGDKILVPCERIGVVAEVVDHQTRAVQGSRLVVVGVEGVILISERPGEVAILRRDAAHYSDRQTIPLAAFEVGIR